MAKLLATMDPVQKEAPNIEQRVAFLREHRYPVLETPSDSEELPGLPIVSELFDGVSEPAEPAKLRI